MMAQFQQQMSYFLDQWIAKIPFHAGETNYQNTIPIRANSFIKDSQVAISAIKMMEGLLYLCNYSIFASSQPF